MTVIVLGVIWRIHMGDVYVNYLIGDSNHFLWPISFSDGMFLIVKSILPVFFFSSPRFNNLLRLLVRGFRVEVWRYHHDQHHDHRHRNHNQHQTPPLAPQESCLCFYLFSVHWLQTFQICINIWKINYSNFQIFHVNMRKGLPDMCQFVKRKIPKNISGPVLRDKEVSFFFRNQGSSITSRGQVPGKFLSRKLQISISRFPSGINVIL